MCRFLVMRARRPFDGAPVLEGFRRICRDSSEYQGHGWGAAYRARGSWSRYRSLTPVWEDELAIPDRVDFIVLHARSAFRDLGTALANNMPFYRDERVFVFNGELRGVRLAVPGRIGAEKVLNLLERNNQTGDEGGGLPRALAATDRLLLSKSDYVRAANVAVTDGETIHALCRYNEAPDYFTLHYRDDDVKAVCSQPLDGHWTPMTNGQQVSL